MTVRAADVPANVVIAGGGVGALETALAIRDRTVHGFAVTLVSPNDDFVYQPISVAEPFLKGPHRAARHLPLVQFAADVDAALVRDSVAAVDCVRRVLVTESGRELAYDFLVVATGARPRAALPGAITLDRHAVGESLSALVADLERGSVSSVAFVIPSRTTWPLPAYELALLTRERVVELGTETQVTVVTAEEKPLGVFGSAATAGVERVLAAAGVQVVVGSAIEVPATGELLVDGRRHACDCVVAMPELIGPGIEGLPANTTGFLPIDAECRVVGVTGVYAIGDATDFPVKYGGIAAHHANVAADSIVGLLPRHGASADPDLHGMLLTARRGTYVYVRARLENGVAQDSRFGNKPTWSPPAKVAARYLGPYLDRLWGVSPPSSANWHAWSFLGEPVGDDPT